MSEQQKPETTPSALDQRILGENTANKFAAVAPAVPKLSGISRRGFASMDKAKQRKIASNGGKAAHATGKAHQFTSEEAAAAGRKGGLTVSQNRDHMKAIGSVGGKSKKT